MLAVKDASPQHYLILNKPDREKSMDKVKGKVSKGMTQQGYKNKFFDDIDNILVVYVNDRKKATPTGDNLENIANKYFLDQVQHRGLPQIILVRGASIRSSMGADITSGDVKTLPANIESGEEVVLLDIHYEVVGYGVAQMSTEEIKRSPGRVAIRTQEGRYDIPKYHGDKRYINGLYSVSTLPRILGVNLMDLKKVKKAIILVICQDNGEIAVEAHKIAPKGSKVFILIRNDNHLKAVKSTLDRLQVEQENFEFIKEPLDRFSKSRPKEKFTHFFLEMQSTETGLRPNPYFISEEKTIISNARNQFSALRSISLIGVRGAEIIYVTHSIDPSENEEVLVQGFRQGNFKPSEISKELHDKYSEGNFALPEIPTVTQAGQINLKKMIEEESYSSSWLSIHPSYHDSDAGFVAKFTLGK